MAERINELELQAFRDIHMASLLVDLSQEERTRIAVGDIRYRQESALLDGVRVGIMHMVKSPS